MRVSSAQQVIPHRDTTSSDINIEEKLHISMTNWISISDEAVFRLLLVVCGRRLYILTLPALKVTDEIPFSHLLGWGWIRVCLTSIFQKGGESLLECLNLRNPLFSLNESVQNEKHQKNKKEKRKLEQCLQQHSSQDEHCRFLWNRCQDKKHPLLSTSKNNENYQGKKCLSFHYNLWEREEQGRLAHPPSYLTEVTSASLSRCQLTQMKSEQAWARCIHRCLEITDCCGWEWKLFCPKL